MARFDAGIIDVAPALAERYSNHYGNALRFLKFGYRRDRRLLRSLARDGQAPDYATALTSLNHALRVGKAHSWFAENNTEVTAHFAHHPAYVGAKTEWQALVDATETTRLIIDAFGERGVPSALKDIMARGGATITEFSAVFKRLEIEWTTFTRALDGRQQHADLADLIPAGCALRLTHDNLAAWRTQLRAFWAAEAASRDLRRIDATRSVDELVDDFTEVDALNTMIRRLLSDSGHLRQQFGNLFAGQETDWDAVLQALDWTQRLKSHFGTTAPPDAFVARLSQPPPVADQEQQLLDVLLVDIAAGIDYVSTIFEPEAFRPAGQRADQSAFTAFEAWLQVRLDHLSGLEEWLDYRHARAQLEQAGLAAFLADLDHDRYPPSDWRDAFLKRFYQLWLDEQYRQIPALGHFRGARHQDLIAEFRRLDRASLSIAPRRVLHNVLGQRPPIRPAAVATSEPAILYREISKRARHKPPSQFFQTGFADASEDAEDDDAPEIYESILDQCNAAGMRTAMLR